MESRSCFQCFILSIDCPPPTLPDFKSGGYYCSKNNCDRPGGEFEKGYSTFKEAWDYCYNWHLQCAYVTRNANENRFYLRRKDDKFDADGNGWSYIEFKCAGNQNKMYSSRAI